MAHQLPHFAAGAAGLNVLGTAGALAARPTGEPEARSVQVWIFFTYGKRDTTSLSMVLVLLSTWHLPVQ